MPLHLPGPPADLPDRVMTKLHAFADGAKFTTPALREARKDHLSLSAPHQVFTMGLDDVAAGGGLDRARPVGWRFLIQEDGHPVASAETTQGPDGTDEVSHFNEGPFVGATDQAMTAVRTLPQLQATGFDLRLLRIPSVYMMALWLHSPDADMLVPLAPSPIGKEGKPVPVAEFFAELAELARQAQPPA
ncbi:MAG: hypothetical protein HOW97_06790 [Catenulispora sp.]|nr:hypothetical protein [Catenulispora sp.]